MQLNNNPSLLVLSAANSIHTLKICNQLSASYNVTLFSLQDPISGYNPDVEIITLSMRNKFPFPFSFLLAIIMLRKIVKNNFDYIHAHYATSYGLLAVLTCPQFFLSVWGSDILIFPNKSILHKILVRYVLKRAKMIFSTSTYLSSKVIEISHVKPILSPFGVDTSLFKPNHNKSFLEFNLIIAKSLKPVYGIDIAIDALSILKQRGFFNINLHIAGGGPIYESLLNKVNELDLQNQVVFHGFLDNKGVAELLNIAHIYLAPSRSESFGVSVVEAASSGVPSICSNIPCFQEVCINGSTGILLKELSSISLADSIEQLLNHKIISTLGNNARDFVLEKFAVDLPSRIYVKHYNYL